MLGQNQGNTISDHSFGRAFDIYQVSAAWDAVERRYLQNTGKNLNAKITSKEAYMFQLDTLLTKLNSMPVHLVPDYMTISSSYADPSYSTVDNLSNKVTTRFPNLKYLKIKLENSGNSSGFIHIGFSDSRGGFYAGPNGRLATSVDSRVLASSFIDRSLLWRNTR